MVIEVTLNKSECVSLVYVLLQSPSQEPRRVEGKLFSLPYKVAFSKKVNNLPLVSQSHWETLFTSEEVYSHMREDTPKDFRAVVLISVVLA